MAALLPNITHTDAYLQLLAVCQSLRNTMVCPCSQQCHLNVHAGSIYGKRWYCSTCKTRKSLHDDSFFSSTHLTLQQIIILMYCWHYDMSQAVIKHETSIDTNHTIIDWCNFLEDECKIWLANNPDKIGCMNANGDLVVVEIDDSKYFHRKYHRLQWREGHWVFKGIKHNTGKCFLTEVPDCSAATLEPRICHHLLSGFHIISDGWPAYPNIDQIGGGMYLHSVIVHQQHFVEPDDPDIPPNMSRTSGCALTKN